MHEVQMWVIILFTLMVFNSLASFAGKVKRFVNEGRNGNPNTLVTVGKLQEVVNAQSEAIVTAITANQDERTQTLILTMRELKGVDSNILEKITELVGYERAKAEFRR